jgi:organic radical activating enzyme
MDNLIDIKEIRSGLVTVDWHFGNWCQNSCSYCAPVLHANSSKKYDLELLKNFTTHIENNLQFDYNQKKIAFNFGGGEPTIQGNFGPYVKYLKEKDHYTSVISNGGRSVRWWDDFCEYFDFITLSFHTEFSDIDHFCKVLDLLTSRKKSVFVILVCWPNMFDKITEAYKQLTKISGVKIFAKKIERSWILKKDVVCYDYTTEQEKWIEEHLSTGNTPNNIYTNNISILSNENKIYSIHPLKIRHYNKNHFKGWQCYQGLKNLSIKVDGSIYGAHCKQEYLGSVYDFENMKWLDAPSVCDQDSCTCVPDMSIDKVKSSS